jgi:ethanolamine permease
MATALSIPATFATAYGFVFASSRVMIAMARSGLYPPLLKRTCGPYEAPCVALLLGSLLGYALVIAVYLRPEIFPYLYNICIMSAFTAYTSQSVGYVMFKLRYPTQERKFISPLGIPGAVFSGLVFTMAFIGIVAFQDDNQVAFISYIGLLAVYTIYYFGYAKSGQYFSPEEDFIFRVHIVKCKYSLVYEQDRTYQTRIITSIGTS